MRIAFVTFNLGRGGAEVQVVDLAVELRRRGHDVLVLALTTMEDLKPALLAADVRYATLDMKSKADVPRALGRYVRMIRDFRPDVIHAHMFAAIVLARLGRWAAPRARLFETAHTTHERGSARYAIYRATERLGLAGRWSCVCSEGLATHLAKGAVRRGTVVRNGVRTAEIKRNEAERAELRRALGLGERDFVWLSVGSFRDEQKDFGTLLQAFADVAGHTAGAHAKLLIAGAGRLWDEKLALATSLGLARSVQLLGLRSDVPALMSAADAFVLASDWEALPLVLLEAASASLPIVATAVGDVARIVHEDTGALVPPHDHPKLASAMLETMHRSDDERSRMGARARERCVTEFDLAAVAEFWEAEYGRS